MAGRRRWPGRVYGVGEEPDPRFSFANERTFLAWVRTALALLAAGVAVDVFVDDLDDGLRIGLAVGLTLLGMACSLGAYLRWASSERALRQRLPLPTSTTLPLLAFGVTLLGLVVFVATLA